MLTATMNETADDPPVDRRLDRGQLVKLPHGQLVLVISEGIIEAVSSGELYRSSCGDEAPD